MNTNKNKLLKGGTDSISASSTISGINSTEVVPNDIDPEEQNKQNIRKEAEAKADAEAEAEAEVEAKILDPGPASVTLAAPTKPVIAQASVVVGAAEIAINDLKPAFNESLVLLGNVLDGFNRVGALYETKKNALDVEIETANNKNIDKKFKEYATNKGLIEGSVEWIEAEKEFKDSIINKQADAEEEEARKRKEEEAKKKEEDERKEAEKKEAERKEGTANQDGGLNADCGLKAGGSRKRLTLGQIQKGGRQSANRTKKSIHDFFKSSVTSSHILKMVKKHGDNKRNTKVKRKRVGKRSRKGRQ